MKSASSSIGRGLAGGVCRGFAVPRIGDGFQELLRLFAPVFGEFSCGGDAVAHLGVFEAVPQDVQEELHDFPAAVGFLAYEFCEGFAVGFGLGMLA